MLPEVLRALHAGLPQQAPGSDAATLRAFARATADAPLGTGARILDIGCGPGRQTLALARASGAHVTAVDLLPDFLAELDARAAEAGLAERIETRRMSMSELDFAPGAFDLVWSEGAIYVMGFEAGLAAWRPLLRPGGRGVVSELCWLTEAPSEAARAFWSRGYPAMRDVPGRLADARAAGWSVLEHFVLEPEAWWSGYYAHLEARLPALEARHADDAPTRALLAGTRAEIALRRDHADEYGYVFFVLEVPRG